MNPEVGQDVNEDVDASVQVGCRRRVHVGEQRRRLALPRQHGTARQEVVVLPRVRFQGLDRGEGDGRKMAGDDQIRRPKTIAKEREERRT